jgi:hypothetical protein
MSDNPVAEIIAGEIANILEKAGAINEWKTLEGALVIIAALEEAGKKIVDREPTKPMMAAGYEIDGSDAIARGCWEGMFDAAPSWAGNKKTPSPE